MGQPLLYNNFILIMSESKYHTIDPLILETLNLNQQRMNHILNIIHGQQPRVSYVKTERRLVNRSRSNHHRVHSNSHDEATLPPILLTNKRNQSTPLQTQEKKSRSKLKINRSNQSLEANLSIDNDRIIEKTQKGQRSEKSSSRKFKSARKTKAQKSIPQEQIINIEEQIHKFQQNKRQQLLKDYMMNKLKKSKSQPLNPKDIYRLQMQAIIAELIPIQELQEAERRMQRLKKRYKHLLVFDKNYYMKLNQHDLIALS